MAKEEKAKASSKRSKTKKTEKQSDDGAIKIILAYVTEQNRPYSAGDIFTNLKGAVGKTLTVRLLASMAKDGLILEKEYGKQKIYFPLQEDGVSVEETDKLQADMDAAKTELDNNLAELRALETELSRLSKTRTIEELQVSYDEISKTNITMKERLDYLKNGAPPVSEEVKKDINKKFENKTKEWKIRKRKCTDIVDMIMENYPKKRSVLFEEVGMETDEEAGVSFEKVCEE